MGGESGGERSWERGGESGEERSGGVRWEGVAEGCFL